MSKGYIVIAQNNDTVDYLEQAYALALNLKLTQSTVSNLTVCVDAKTKKLITAKHKKVFDNLVYERSMMRKWSMSLILFTVNYHNRKGDWHPMR